VNAAVESGVTDMARGEAWRFPVVIVGAGPTGLTLANLLGVYGVPTLLIERHPGTVGEPRAVSIDDESLRTMQNAGAIEEVLRDVVQSYGVHYHAWNGRVFARILPTSLEYGFPKRSAFRQQNLEATLHRALARHASVQAWFSHELKGLAQDETGIRITVGHAGGQEEIACDWLVACDGGRSTVRDLLGITLRGETYAERWLIVDMLERTTPFRHTRTYCDPVRPTIRLPGPHGSLRYEFMLHEHERPEDVLDEGKIRAWMREREPADENLPIIRKVVYTFHARIAPQWRKGRVLLAGDAAHLTPPFAGQGMNSGVRDAFNLAWKLAEVTQGRAGPGLLESYEQERAPHAWALIRMALTIGRYMQPKSRASAMLMQAVLRLISLYPPARDYVLHLKFKPKPRYAKGFFVPRPVADKQRLRPGQLFIQPKVELPGGARVLLDELLGPGHALLAWLGERAMELPGGLPCKALRLVRRDDDFPPQAREGLVVRDCDGLIEQALAQMNATQVLLRPDRYVLAACNQGDAAATARSVLDLFAATRESRTIVG
jgi:3-(3-hydroxy-phenyl)propionate hydroxylase